MLQDKDTDNMVHITWRSRPSSRCYKSWLKRNTSPVRMVMWETLQQFTAIFLLNSGIYCWKLYYPWFWKDTFNQSITCKDFEWHQMWMDLQDCQILSIFWNNYDQSFVVFKEVGAIQYVGDVFLLKLCSLVIRIMQVPSSCLFESR